MDLLRYTRIIVLTALFLIPTTALIVSSSMYFPFITGKNFLFRMLVEVAFVGWVVLALCDATYRPRKSLALWFGFAFVCAIGISTVFAENPVKAFWSNFERMEGYITILHLAAYVLVLTTVMNTEKLWRNFFYTSLGVATIVGIYSVFQLLGAFTINQGGLRIDATFGNATYFAVYMLIHAFLALYVYVRWSHTRWERITLGTLFSLFSILVFYSATRGSILGLIGGLTITGVILVLSRGVHTSLRNTGVVLVIAVLALVAVFFGVKDTSYVENHPILSRIASISVESGNARFMIWNMALQGALERPLFGWGQEGFNYVFNKYYVPEMVTQEPWFDRAHNVVLDWLVAGGFIGMLLYLSLYAVLVWYLWRPSNPFDTSERALLTGLLAAYGFHNLFVFDNLLSYVMFMLLFSYITFRSFENRPTSSAPALADAQVALPVAAVSLIVLVYLCNWPGYATATGIIQGLSPHKEGVAKNLEYFKDASRYTGLGRQEVGEQFLQFASQVSLYNVGDSAFKTSVLQSARQGFDGVLTQAPDDARLRVFYGSYLRQVGDYDGARKNLEQALQLSPKKQSILLEYGLLDLAQGQYADAVTRFSAIYATAPTYAQTHIYLISAALLARQDALAKELLIKHFGTEEPSNTSIANAYLQAGQYQRAVRIAERIAIESPTADSFKFLAGVYMQGKDTARAIAALEQGKQVDPKFGAEADSYIAQIRAGTR